MDKISKKGLPVGISILRYFYILNVFLLSISTLIFYKNIGVSVWGVLLPPIQAMIATGVLIIFPFYIYLDLKVPQLRVFSAMLCYHIFFLINSIFTIFYILNKSSTVIPLLQIVDINKGPIDVPGALGYTIKHISIQGLNIAISAVILFYIWRRRNLFFKKGMS